MLRVLVTEPHALELLLQLEQAALMPTLPARIQVPVIATMAITILMQVIRRPALLDTQIARRAMVEQLTIVSHVHLLTPASQGPPACAMVDSTIRAVVAI